MRTGKYSPSLLASDSGVYFFQKAGEVFQVREPTGHRERTPDHFADGLLHWLNFDLLHQGKLNSSNGRPSTAICQK
jgi:hypothetical protein